MGQASSHGSGQSKYHIRARAHIQTSETQKRQRQQTHRKGEDSAESFMSLFSHFSICVNLSGHSSPEPFQKNTRNCRSMINNIFLMGGSAFIGETCLTTSWGCAAWGGSQALCTLHLSNLSQADAPCTSTCRLPSKLLPMQVCRTLSRQ